MSILFASLPLRAVLKHVQSKDCEYVFNAVVATQVVIQRLLKQSSYPPI